LVNRGIVAITAITLPKIVLTFSQWNRTGEVGAVQGICHWITGMVRPRAVVAAVLLLALPLKAAELLQWPCQRALVTRAATNMPPYAYLDGRRQLTGYRVELLQQVFKRLNCPLQIRTDVPWKRSLLLLQSGELDLMVNASKTPERERFAYFSASVEDEYVALYQLKKPRGGIKLTSLAQAFSGHYNIGLIRGNHYGTELNQRLQDEAIAGHLVEAIDKPALYQMLLRQRVDFYLDYYPNGLFALRDERLDHRIEHVPASLQHIGTSHYMFSKQSVTAAFVRAFDAEFARMQGDGTVAALRERYNLQP
jgi:polar amino acid transport system substrate-binding protein